MKNFAKSIFTIIFLLLLASSMFAEYSAESLPLLIEEYAHQPMISQMRSEPLELQINAAVVRGADIDAQIDRDLHFGDTALHRAIFHKYYSLVPMLLEHGASPDIENDSDETPLEYLVGHHDRAKFKVVKALVEAAHGLVSSDVLNAARKHAGFADETLERVSVPASGAIHNQDYAERLVARSTAGEWQSIYAYLKKQTAYDKPKKAIAWEKALLGASKQEKLEVLNEWKDMIKAGSIDAHHRELGYTAMQLSVVMGLDDIVDFLIEAGYDPNSRNEQGESDFEWLIRKSIELEKRYRLLIGPTDARNMIRKVFVALVGSGADLLQKDKRDRTLLEQILDVQNGPYVLRDFAILLVKHGGGANFKEDFGHSYAWEFRFNKRIEPVDLMEAAIESDRADELADLDFFNLIAALKWDSARMDTVLQAWVNNGGNLDGPKIGGSTLLHDAISDGNLSAFKSLLDLGADPNLKNEDGDRGVTPLQMARIFKNKSFESYLLKMGAKEEPTTLQKFWSYVSGGAEASDNL